MYYHLSKARREKDTPPTSIEKGSSLPSAALQGHFAVPLPYRDWRGKYSQRSAFFVRVEWAEGAAKRRRIVALVRALVLVLALIPALVLVPVLALALVPVAVAGGSCQRAQQPCHHDCGG